MASSSPPFRVITKTSIDTHEDIPEDHPCVRSAQQMAEVHNSIIRLCNASYLQAPDIRPGTQTAADFMLWNKFIIDLIHEHHLDEEQNMFPQLEDMVGQPGLLSINVEQHHAFETPLDNLYKYITTTTQMDYDGIELRRLWEEVAPPLQRHLEEELDTFYQLKDADIKKFRELLTGFVKAAEARTDMFTQAPLFLGAQDASFPGVNGKPPVLFSDMPAFAPYMIHYICEWRYHRLWKFNPADTWGRVKQHSA